MYAAGAPYQDEEKPIELILYKAENQLEEILLKAQLKMQKGKNDLIKNFEKDVERVAELVTIEDDLSEVKAEMDEVSTILDERISIEKDTLTIKAKE